MVIKAIITGRNRKKIIKSFRSLLIIVLSIKVKKKIKIEAIDKIKP